MRLTTPGDSKREQLYGEYGEDGEATRMLHDGRFKLIYYATGNRLQLFDLQNDPLEQTDLVDSADHSEVVGRLTTKLVAELHGTDTQWLEQGRLVGFPTATGPAAPDRTLSLQRGRHWPVPPQS